MQKVDLIPSDEVTRKLLVDVLAKMVYHELTTRQSGAVSEAEQEESHADQDNHRQTHSASGLRRACLEVSDDHEGQTSRSGQG
jgi:hypothetical protein